MGERSAEPNLDSHCKTFCEFFAGIGLVRAGLSRSGWECVYANDIDPKKLAMYRGRFGAEDHFHLGDVWETEAVVSRIEGRPALATASFPCVDLSLAGHWRGLSGEHSSAFFGFSRVLAALGSRRPPLVLVENVPGLITSRAGKDFETVARSLADLGYWVDAFLLDAACFVPQSRSRVFLVGVDDAVAGTVAVRQQPGRGWMLGEWSKALDSSHHLVRPPELARLMRAIDLPTGWAAFRVPRPTAPVRGVDSVIDLDDDQDWWDDGAVAKHYAMMHDRHRARVRDFLDRGVSFVGTIYRRKRDGQTRAEVRFDGVAGCLRTPKGGSARQIVVAVDGGRLRMRWMSPREYARLQGAADYPLAANAIRNLHGFGDAVCVPVIEWIDRYVLTPAFEAMIGPSAEPAMRSA